MAGFVASVAGAALGAPAAWGQSRKVPRFIPPLLGTRWTYTVTDGPDEQFERLADGGWQTRQVLSYRRDTVGGAAPQIRSHIPTTGNWIVTRTLEGEPLFSAKPDDRRYRWPIKPGTFWRSHYTFRDHRREREFDGLVTWRVEALERIASPVGPLLTFRVVSSGTPQIQKVWFAWELGVEAREITYEGDRIVRARELTGFTPPDPDAEPEPEPDPA